MKKSYLLIPAVIAAFLIEVKLSVFGIRPGLTTLLAYYVGLKSGAARGTAFGAIVGLIADSLSGGIIGPNVLAKGAVGFFASYMAGGLFLKWTALLGFIGVLFLTALDGIAAYASTAFFVLAPTSLHRAALIIFGQAALNSIAGPFIRPNEN